jgi:predicted nuclease of predicted toxin-antitoxin system
LKFLVDENLAPRLMADFADLYPGSVHVGSAQLGSTPDLTIWEFAKANGFIFLRKDKDFASLSITWGAPPKVILLQTGNGSTADIEAILRGNAIRIADFERDGKRSLLVLK